MEMEVPKVILMVILIREIKGKTTEIKMVIIQVI
jgi:hypothetical protein